MRAPDHIPQAEQNNTVFCLFWNCPTVVDDVYRVGGRSFQMEGAKTKLPMSTNTLSFLCIFLYGRRAFSVAGLMTWNSLTDSLRDPSLSIDSFRRHLKTFLFDN